MLFLIYSIVLSGLEFTSGFQRQLSSLWSVRIETLHQSSLSFNTSLLLKVMLISELAPVNPKINAKTDILFFGRVLFVNLSPDLSHH